MDRLEVHRLCIHLNALITEAYEKGGEIVSLPLTPLNLEFPTEFRENLFDNLVKFHNDQINSLDVWW